MSFNSERSVVPRLWAWVASQFDMEQQRWFLWCPVAMGLGIGIYFLLPWEPRLSLILLSLVMFSALTWALRTRFISLLFSSFIMIVLIGVLVIKLKAMLMASPIVPDKMYNVKLRGFVEVLEVRPKEKSRLTIRVMELGDLATEKLPFRVTIALRRPCNLTQCQPGQAVELQSFMRSPPGPSMPGGYSFARSAYFHGVGGVGFSSRLPKVWVSKSPAPPGLKILSGINRLRNLIAQRVLTVLDGDAGAIATALLVGLRGGISQDALESMRASGLAHVLAVSGLHMSLMAGCLFWFIRAVLTIKPFLVHGWPVKKIAAIIALLGASAYLCLSGASTATWRAYAMIAVIFLAILCGRVALTMRNVALAACLVMLIKPESLFTPGFQMSFAATIGLIAVYEKYSSWNLGKMGAMNKTHAFLLLRVLLFLATYLLSIIVTTLIASTVTAPFAAYHFCRVSSFAIIGNLLAMPIVTLIVMPACLAVLLLIPFGLEALPLSLMGWGIDKILWVASLISELPGADLRVSRMPFISLLLFAIGGLWLAIWNCSWRFLAIVPIIVSSILAYSARSPDLLVDGTGKTIAVRNADTGMLDVFGAQKANFTVSRWLQQDGDMRDPAYLTSTFFNCDRTGCIAPLADGGLVALVHHPAALLADCAIARIVIITFHNIVPCIGPERVISKDDLQHHGVHAFWLNKNGIREKHARFAPGIRPWRP